MNKEDIKNRLKDIKLKIYKYDEDIDFSKAYILEEKIQDVLFFAFKEDIDIELNSDKILLNVYNEIILNSNYYINLLDCIYEFINDLKEEKKTCGINKQKTLDDLYIYPLTDIYNEFADECIFSEEDFLIKLERLKIRLNKEIQI